MAASPDAAASALARVGRYVSKRHQLSVSLPDGRAWTIDDHSAEALVASHAPSAARLEVQTTREDILVNRQRCEEKARARGFIPNTPLALVHDETMVGPGDFDSRLWVAIGSSNREPGLEGHVFLVGAHIKRCLWVHYRSSVASPDDERLLAERLALAETRIVRTVLPDAARTADDGAPRRERPEPRRN